MRTYVALWRQGWRLGARLLLLVVLLKIASIPIELALFISQNGTFAEYSRWKPVYVGLVGLMALAWVPASVGAATIIAFNVGRPVTFQKMLADGLPLDQEPPSKDAGSSSSG